MQFWYQYNPKCPLSFEEYTDKISKVELAMVIGNERFDPSDTDEPIQRLITDQYNGHFSPKTNNLYSLFIGKNTYEIEGGIFSSSKTGKFYTVNRENILISELPNTPQKTFLKFDVRLDAKVKHYNSMTYGIIEAIGTLGGVFEILFWILMLFYGSLSEKMYLLSVINTLTQDEAANPKIYNSNEKVTPMSTITPDHA